MVDVMLMLLDRYMWLEFLYFYPRVSLGCGLGNPRDRAFNPPAIKAKGWNCIAAAAAAAAALDEVEDEVEVGREAKEAVKRFLV